jgi:hypothetical protein
MRRATHRRPRACKPSATHSHHKPLGRLNTERLRHVGADVMQTSLTGGLYLYGLQTPSDAIPAFGRHSPSNASHAYGLHAPSDAIPALGRHSLSNAAQAYGLQMPSDAIPAVGRHSQSNGDRLRRPKDRLRPAFPEQRIAGLRPTNPKRRNPGLLSLDR